MRVSKNRKHPSGEPLPEEDTDEGLQQSSKRGKASDSKKSATRRHGYGPAPETSPTSGAFGAGIPQGGDDLGEMGGPVPGEAGEPGEEDDEV